MKIFLRIIVFAAVLCLSALDMWAWGRSGHNAVAAIAEKHLTKKARKEISKILDGKSIVYYSDWMDRIRKLPEYAYTDQWHSNYMDADGNFILDNAYGKYKGSALYGLRTQVLPVLENREQYDDSTVNVNLKFLVHLIADMHCPVHIRYAVMPSMTVKYKGKKMGYHAFWDTTVLDEVFVWSYSEYVEQLDTYSRKEIAEVCKGSIEDWAMQTSLDTRVIFTWIEQDIDFDSARIIDASPIAARQLQLAGYRLAHIINELFK